MNDKSKFLIDKVAHYVTQTVRLRSFEPSLTQRACFDGRVEENHVPVTLDDDGNAHAFCSLACIPEGSKDGHFIIGEEGLSQMGIDRTCALCRDDVFSRDRDTRWNNQRSPGNE